MGTYDAEDDEGEDGEPSIMMGEDFALVGRPMTAAAPDGGGGPSPARKGEGAGGSGSGRVGDAPEVMILGDPRLEAEEEGEIFAVDGEPFEESMGPGVHPSECRITHTLTAAEARSKPPLRDGADILGHLLTALHHETPFRPRHHLTHPNTPVQARSTRWAWRWTPSAHPSRWAWRSMAWEWARGVWWWRALAGRQGCGGARPLRWRCGGCQIARV